MSNRIQDVYSDPIIGKACLAVVKSETRALKRFENELGKEVQNNNFGETSYDIFPKFPKILDLLLDPSAELGHSALFKATVYLEISNGLKVQRLRKIKADIEGIQKMSIDQAGIRKGIAKEQRRVSSQIKELKAAVAEEGLVACMASMSLDNSFKIVKARNRLSSVQAAHPATNVSVVQEAIQKFKELLAKRNDILKRTEQLVYTRRRNSPTKGQKTVSMSEILNVTSEKLEERKKELELLEERIQQLASTTSTHQDQSFTLMY